MRFSFLQHLGLTKFGPVGSSVDRDADDLVRQWGGAAFEKATDLSWREDSGLIQSPGPGHWWNVRQEIGRRSRQADVGALRVPPGFRWLPVATSEPPEGSAH